MLTDTNPMKKDLKALRFFEALTGDEQVRLRTAVDAYGAVMALNLDARWASQAEGAREEAARPLSWKTMSAEAKDAWVLDYGKNPRASWELTQRLLNSIASGGLVGGKSALLGRLIAGRPALRERPPCSFSYPWYELVEASGATMVTTIGLSGAMSLGSLMNGSGGGSPEKDATIAGVTSLVINQSTYRLVTANEAGRNLLSLVVEMLESPDGEREVDDWRLGGTVKRMIPSITRRHRLWDEILAAYASGPEFGVRHGGWPTWRLFVGSRVGVVDVAWAMEGLRKGPFSQIADVNPLDLAFAGLNATVVQDGESRQAGPPADARDAEAERIGNVLRGQPPDWKASLTSWPATDGWAGGGRGEEVVVRLQTACWMLEKTADWAGVDPVADVSRVAVEDVVTGGSSVGNG